MLDVAKIWQISMLQFVHDNTAKMVGLESGVWTLEGVVREVRALRGN